MPGNKVILDTVVAGLLHASCYVRCSILLINHFPGHLTSGRTLDQPLSVLFAYPSALSLPLHVHSVLFLICFLTRKLNRPLLQVGSFKLGAKPGGKQPSNPFFDRILRSMGRSE